MVGEKFQIYGVQITGKCISNSKRIWKYLLMPHQKKLAPGYHHPLDRGKLLIPSTTAFYKNRFPPAEWQEETMRTTQNDIKCRFNLLQPKVMLHGSENCPVKEDRCSVLDQNRYHLYVENDWIPWDNLVI